MIKLALVTGATSGIGEALTHFLEAQGIETIATGRNPLKLSQFKGKTLALDLAKDRSELCALIRSEAPDLIVNNAGFGLYGKADELSIEEELAMVEVNCKALLELTLEGIKALKLAGKTGTIINISSAASFQPMPSLAVYAATKAFVTHLSQSLDQEFKGEGIRILASCPGRVATDFSARASKKPGHSSSDKMEVSFAVKEIWKQIQSGQPVRIFDFKTRLQVRFAQFFLPNRLIAYLLSKTRL